MLKISSATAQNLVAWEMMLRRSARRVIFSSFQ